MKKEIGITDFQKSVRDYLGELPAFVTIDNQLGKRITIVLDENLPKKTPLKQKLSNFKRNYLGTPQELKKNGHLLRWGIRFDHTYFGTSLRIFRFCRYCWLTKRQLASYNQLCSWLTKKGVI